MMRRVSSYLIGLTVLLGLGCEGNEPYVLLPLVVTSIEGGAPDSLSSYTYKNGRIATFTRTTPTDTLSLKFFYENDLLISIQKDSTSAGYELVRVHGYGSGTAIDSTFYMTGDLSQLRMVRKFVYDASHNVKRVELVVWNDGIVSQSVHELNWADGNVTDISTSRVEDGEEVEHLVSMTYDKKKGVFSTDVDYEYTLDPEALYWMSANNPLRFKRDESDETKIGYLYNTKDYPSHIELDIKQVFDCSYAEIR